MGKIEKSTGSVSVIGGNDGPTTIFLGGKKKRSLKQKMQRLLFRLRKKWYSLWVKPGAHSMDEVKCYVEEVYGFVEAAQDTHEYLVQYDEVRTSFVIQYEPALLGEYAVLPKMSGHDEESVKAFLEQVELRNQKVQEIPKEAFPIDFHILKKTEDGNNMELSLESRFGYIGGGFSGPGKDGKRRYQKIYKDVYRYYGVTEEDIVHKTRRYEDLLRTLAMRG